MLAKREEINHILRAKLDEVTERWGVKITSVEIREIVPPRDIQDAMNRQMSAERNRRAVITESEGTRQATINVAEGDKQSNILRAEGDRQSQILRAEGYANALQTIFGAASGIDQKTMALQYLETLKALAASEGTTWIVPMELSELTRPISHGDAADAASAEPTTEPTIAADDRAALRPHGRAALGLVAGVYLAYVAVRGSRVLVRPVVASVRARCARTRRRCRPTSASTTSRSASPPMTASRSRGWLIPAAPRDADRGDRAARLQRQSPARAGGLRAVAAASVTTCSSSTSAGMARASPSLGHHRLARATRRRGRGRLPAFARPRADRPVRRQHGRRHRHPRGPGPAGGGRGRRCGVRARSAIPIASRLREQG